MAGKERAIVFKKVFILRMSGLLYPPNWEQNWCKKKLYDIYSFAIVCWMPTNMLVLMLNVFNHLDDVFAATDALFPALTTLNMYITYLYFLRNRHKLLKLINRIETEFIFHINRVGSSERKEAILSERSKNSKRITDIMFAQYIFAMIFWAVFPWLLGYIEYFIKTDEELANIEMEKYFGALMVLPENVNKSPIYEIVQIYHFIATYCTATILTASYMIMFILTYHTATLFKLTCAAFEDFDYFESKIRSELGLQCDSFKTDEGYNSDFVRPSAKRQSGYFDGNTFEDHVETFRSANENEFKTSNINSDVFNANVNEEYQTRVHKYLVHCVEFHQAVIRYTDDLNDLFSPMIFICFIFTEVMLCLSAFQLVLAKMDERKIKFLASSTILLLWPLLLCKYGDDLMSSAVKESVFNTHWYHQSKSFNKLIQMVMIRAQQPVTIRAGKFYIATLETYSNICNKVYAYFTLLRQMYDD